MQADLEKAHGFGRLLEVVAQSGKLVVGHNMVLDVVHLLSQFVDDLPKVGVASSVVPRGDVPVLKDVNYQRKKQLFRKRFASLSQKLS